MTRLRIPLVVLVTATLLAVSACASESDGAAPPSSSPSPSRTGPPASGGTFSSLQEIAAKLRESGLLCAGLRDIDYEIPGRSAAGSCTTEDGGDVILATYTDPAVLAREVEAKESAPGITLGGRSASMVSGENWNLVAPDVWADRAHQVLGGTLTVGK